MNVLLSIKPEFSRKIFEGTKKYEFRKRIFKNQNISKIIVYETAPTHKIVGEFEIEEIFNDSITALWERTKDSAGISNSYFLEYFSQVSTGYAIKIKSTFLYDEPVSIFEKYNMTPPQSFVYVDD